MYHFSPVLNETIISIISEQFYKTSLHKLIQIFPRIKIIISKIFLTLTAKIYLTQIACNNHQSDSPLQNVPNRPPILINERENIWNVARKQGGYFKSYQRAAYLATLCFGRPFKRPALFSRANQSRARTASQQTNYPLLIATLQKSFAD